MVVEQDDQSKTNAIREVDTSNTINDLLDEGDSDLPTSEQPGSPPTSPKRDYYLSGLAMGNPTNQSRDKRLAAPEKSINDTPKTQNSHVTAEHPEGPEGGPPTVGLNPMDRYLSDDSDDRYADFVLKTQVDRSGGSTPTTRAGPTAE